MPRLAWGLSRFLRQGGNLCGHLAAVIGKHTNFNNRLSFNRLGDSLGGKERYGKEGGR